MEAVGQLTGGIAHDFNNLLTIILGGLDTIGRQLSLLPASAGAARIARARDMALHGAQRAATLTTRLLAFARQQPLAPRSLDPNKLVSGMAEFLRRTLGEPIALETVLAAGLWRTYADGHQLENALLNLALNARDAMPGSGKLSIETANCYFDAAYVGSLAEPVAAGQYVMIAVADTGDGMDQTTVDRAFEPFFTTKESGKGTGLGLSQVYGFVRQSAGHVKIYSESGEGTTVKIYLPRYLGADEHQERRESAAERTGRSAPKPFSLPKTMKRCAPSRRRCSANLATGSSMRRAARWHSTSSIGSRTSISCLRTSSCKAGPTADNWPTRRRDGGPVSRSYSPPAIRATPSSITGGSIPASI
jgi:hypothetical protein